MKTKLIVLSSVVAVGVLAFAAGRFFAPLKVIESTGETKTIVKTQAGNALELERANTEIAALKATIADLQKQATIAPPQPGPAPQEVQAERQQNRGQTFKEYMEKMQKEDPERYKEMVERRAQMRQMMKDAQASREDFLTSIDTTLLTDEQQAVHARYIEAIKKQSDLQEAVMASMEAGEEPSQELRDQMRELRMEAGQIQQAERTALMTAVGTSIGLSDDEAAELNELVDTVYNATSAHGPRPQMGGRGGPQGGGRGGR